ncbi:MAG: Tfp pilus assembly protein FimT/FimU [Planctomycetota bacterium]
MTNFADEARSPTARERLQAFTLVEITMVVLVLAILAGLVVPQFAGSREEAVLRGAARELVAVLQLAASESITSRRVHRFCVDSERGIAWVEVLADLPDGSRSFQPITLRLASGRGGGLGERTRPEQSGRKSVRGGSEPANVWQLDPTLEMAVVASAANRGETLAPPVNASAQSATASGVISFYADGTADARDLVLIGRADEAMRLRVHSVTGRVELQRERDGAFQRGRRT